MRTDIFSIPLSNLQKIHNGFTEEFLTTLIKEVPAFGKEHERYYLLNNHLTLGSQEHLQFYQIFNVLLQLSRTKCNILQITKN